MALAFNSPVSFHFPIKAPSFLTTGAGLWRRGRILRESKAGKTDESDGSGGEADSIAHLILLVESGDGCGES